MHQKQVFQQFAIPLLVAAIILVSVSVLSYYFNKSFTTVAVSSALQKYNGYSFLLDGEKISISQGTFMAENLQGGLSSSNIQYFGNDVIGDFDTDGKQDVAFIVTRETSGDVIFYYVVTFLKVGLNTGGRTEAFFIGDRIAPQSTEIKDGKILIVNYADRKNNESLTTLPSVGTSLYLQLDTKTRRFEKVENK